MREKLIRTMLFQKPVNNKKEKRNFFRFVLLVFVSCFSGMLLYQFKTMGEFNSYWLVADVIGSGTVTAALSWVFYYAFDENLH